jgi:hypothetical protein
VWGNAHYKDWQLPYGMTPFWQDRVIREFKLVCVRGAMPANVIWSMARLIGSKKVGIQMMLSCSECSFIFRSSADTCHCAASPTHRVHITLHIILCSVPTQGGTPPARCVQGYVCGHWPCKVMCNETWVPIDYVCGHWPCKVMCNPYGRVAQCYVWSYVCPIG